MVAAISLLMVGGAGAQTAGDTRSTAKVQAANAEWRRLSQTEINCVDRTLQARRSGVWALIQRGVGPSNSTVGALRAACRANAGSPQAPTQPRALQAAAAPKPAAAALTVLAASPKQDGATGQAEATKVTPAVTDKVTFKTMSETAAAERAAVDKSAPDKAAAEKAAADKAAAEKVAADKAATDKAAAEKAAADKAVADKVAAEKAAADKAAAIKVVAGKTAAEKTAADKPATDQSALELAKVEAERARADAERAQAEADRARKDAEKTIAEVGFALAVAE